MYQARKLIAILCLALLLLAALTPGASGFGAAILARFWLLLEILALLSIQPIAEDRDPHSFSFASTVPSRTPPLQ